MCVGDHVLVAVYAVVVYQAEYCAQVCAGEDTYKRAC